MDRISQKKHLRHDSYSGEVYCYFLPKSCDYAAKHAMDKIGNIIWLVCRMVTIFLFAQRSRLIGTFKYLERVHKLYRNFSRSIWKKSFSSKHEVLSQYLKLTLSSISCSYVSWNLFSNASGKFSVDFMYTFMVSRRFYLLISWRWYSKSWEWDTLIRLISVKANEMNFLKNE